MGIVYVATSDGRGLFVIKQLKADLARDPEFRLMLADEARIAARIHHANVVRTLGAGFDGRLHYIEMEYLEGQPFDALARRASDPLPMPLAVFVLARTLDGLHAAHELTDDDGKPLGVVHRDVSPHNVFVTYAGHVKVLDFGVAKAADSLSRTRTGMVKGKARYMAPEQAVRARIDRRADVFAVGLLLWEVLAGRRAWDDMPDQEIVAALQKGAMASPRTHRADVPERLEAICMRAIATRPEDRFATAAEMARALDEWIVQSGERVGETELGRFVAERFAEERTALAEEIALAQSKLAPRRSPKRAWAALAIVIAAMAAFAVVRVRARSTHIAAATPSTAPRARECKANADCASRASPSICRAADGACVALASIDCHVEADADAVASDATLWIGTMFPLTGPDATAFGTANALAADLARRELMEIAHGVPSRTPGVAARPLGIVACDDAIDPTRAARHLVDDLHVPAVIGFRASGEVLDLATTLFIPNGVLTLPALNRSALIRDLPHPPGSPRLVYRTTLSIAESTPVTVAVVRDLLEPTLRAPGGPLGREPMRVALLRNSAIASRSLADALTEQLRFNGKSLVENGEGLFRDFTFPEDVGDAGAATYAELAAAIVAFRPHVIVHVNRQFVRELIEPIETNWPRDARARPVYLLSGAPWEGESFLAFLGTNAERRRRFLGMSTPTSTPANVKFTERFNAVSTQKVTLADAPNSAYDAFYLAAFAAFAAGDDARTGVDLARAIRRLVPPGKRVDVGAEGILAAFSILRDGGNVDLQGASGTLDFDLATGEPADDFVILCIGVDAAGRASDPIESGVVYDATSKTMRGRMRCP
jgi:serine/threonine-protein kinase